MLGQGNSRKNVRISRPCFVLCGTGCSLADIRTPQCWFAPLADSVTPFWICVLLNTFCLKGFKFLFFLKLVMSASAKNRLCWRKDLSEFRGLSDRERAGFLLVLEWFENFRLRHDLEANRDAAKIFWRTEVLREDRPRQQWQLDQWGDATRGRIDD